MTNVAFPSFANAQPDNEIIRIYDPRNGREVGTVHSATRDEAREAVGAARAAQPLWAQVPAAARGKRLEDAADRLEEAQNELAELNTRETGRPTDQALAGIRAGIDTLRQYAQLGPLHRGHSLLGSRGASDYTSFEPRGVVVVLTPWNDAIAIACGLIGAAVVAGNTVVHKPSERCPHLGLRFGQLMAEALPPEVLTTLPGGSALGSVLAADLGVDAIAHVGSTASGRAITRVAALSGAHVVLENGGNDALIIDADVDPAWAAKEAAIGAFANSGQVCTSVERIFVHRDIAAEFTRHLVAEAEALNDRRGLGPLVDERMRAHVDGHVQDATAAGATVLAGGEVPLLPGSYYPATVLAGCTPQMAVMREETFGPVAPICEVGSFEEGVALAEDDAYGLSATVFTGAIDHAELAIAELPVGTIKVNEVFGGAPGGAAQPRAGSGRGYGYGPELLDELTMAKVVHLATPAWTSAALVGAGGER